MSITKKEWKLTSEAKACVCKKWKKMGERKKWDVMMGVTSQTTIINRCNYLSRSLPHKETGRLDFQFKIVVRRKTAKKLEEKKNNREFTIWKTHLPYHSQTLDADLETDVFLPPTRVAVTPAVGGGTSSDGGMSDESPPISSEGAGEGTSSTGGRGPSFLSREECLMLLLWWKE